MNDFYPPSSGLKQSSLRKELLDMLEMALRQFRADVRPDRAMELVQSIVVMIKLNGGI